MMSKPLRLEQRTYVKGAFAVALLTVVAAPLPAQYHEFPPDLKSAEQEINEAESRRFRAMLEGDAVALGRLLSDDLTYIHGDGRVDTKAGLISAIQSGELKYGSITPGDAKLRLYGSTAVIMGEVSMKVRNRGQDLDVRLRYTDVYVKRQGQWQMVAWQSTRMIP